MENKAQFAAFITWLHTISSWSGLV